MYRQTLRHIVKSATSTGITPSQGCGLNPWLCRFSSTQSPIVKESKPLRILFCGSDRFSATSLIALYRYKKENTERILSIDVLIRPGKFSGRGHRLIKEVYLKNVAQFHRLTIHERDTFTGWDLPRPNGEPINLIVAVSFGLFVPPRILNSVEYGGLNVHPSLLPDFYGPAPIHHQILKQSALTGVTLQTLDDKAFDQGIILDQTPQAEAIAAQRGQTFTEFTDYIGTKGAEMLVRGIDNRVYVPPLVERGWYSKSPENLTYAHKTTSADTRADFVSSTAREIVLKSHAFRRLWCKVWTAPGTVMRLILEEIEHCPVPPLLAELRELQRQGPVAQKDLVPLIERGLRFMVFPNPKKKDPATVPAQAYVNDEEVPGCIIVVTSNASETERTVRVKSITMEGEVKKSAAACMNKIRDLAYWSLGSDKNRRLFVERSQKDSNLARAVAITKAKLLGKKHEL